MPVKDVDPRYMRDKEKMPKRPPCLIILFVRSWLHKHVAMVGQEPVLFALSVGDNIRYGKVCHEAHASVLPAH